MSSKLLNLSRKSKTILVAIIDVLLMLVSLYLAISLRENSFVPLTHNYLLALLPIPFLTFILFKFFGVYRLITRYFDENSLIVIFKAISSVVIVWLSLLTFYQEQLVPRSVWIIFWFIAMTIFIPIRIMISKYFVRNNHSVIVKNVVIYGVGEAGKQLFSLLKNTKKYKVIAFIDDSNFIGSSLFGCRVYTPEQFKKYYFGIRITNLFNVIDSFFHKKIKVDQFFIAIPSATQEEITNISQYLAPFNLPIKILPKVEKFIDGKISLDKLQTLSISDLLYRKGVISHQDLLNSAIFQKNVLVTGAGGSIGRQLCLEIAKQKPKLLVLFELNEFALYQIQQQLKEFDVEIIAILGDIRNTIKLTNILKKRDIEIVFHAAAYKHVPLVEENPFEAIDNNILGSLSVVNASLTANIKKCILISTDKAVRPTNIMGATKRFAELIFQGFNALGKTKFSMVRFGNVLGSSGSVVPLFKQQIEAGGPITITHKDITRYFMTIPEAAELVIQASALAIGGEVFVLDMGESVKIIDLAKKMILLSGKDIEIKEIGLREGEKLYEELLIDGSGEKTQHPKITKAKEKSLSMSELENFIKQYQECMKDRNIKQLKQLLINSQTGYNER